MGEAAHHDKIPCLQQEAQWNLRTLSQFIGRMDMAGTGL